MEYEEREIYMARLEAEMNESSSQFFNTRPDLDIPFNVKMFDQGFERGFDVASKEDAIAIPANADLSMLQAAVNKYKNTPMKIVDGSKSSMSMGENVGWIEGSHDAVTAVRDMLIAGEGYRKDISSLGAGLRSITLECAKLIEENDELSVQIDLANKRILKDVDLKREAWKLKQLFIDLTFCYLNPEMSKTLYADTNKDFKEIVGDDPEFIDKKESES